MFDGAAVVTAADAASVHVDRPVGSSASHAAATWDGGARSAGGGERATKTSAPAATHEPERRDDGCAPPPCADASDAGASDADAATPTATLQLVASSEGTSGGDKVVPGEVLRYRMVVAVPEGSVAGAELRLQLAPGLRFVADDTTTVALVSDDRGLDSSRLSGTRLDVTGGGDGVGSIASIVPLQRLQGDALVGADGRPVPACTVLDAGDGPRILLGDLDNLDRDCGAEFVVVEFDAVVDNAAGNVRGDALPVSFSWVADGAVRAVSNTVEVCVGEPSIVDLDARVVEVTGTHVVFEATFGNSGDQVAHDVRLVDAFDASSGLGFGGAWTVSGLPQGAVNASTADTLDLRLPTLAPGETVTVRYDACLADAAAPAGARDVVVTYTSLSECGGELTVAADGGSATSTTTGERTGDTTDYGGPANVYRDVDRVALGAVSGTLWNDTPNADGLIGATEARLPGVTVTLTLSGPDGALGSGDDLTRTAITDASGFYAFGATPAGALRVTAPTLLADAGGATGALRVRTDARGDPTDATMDVALAEGATVDRLDVGYVQLNRAPTVTAPERATVTEDVRSALSGVSIGDADADAADALTVTLGVDDGRLDVLAAGGVGVSGNGTASLVLTGPIAAINATLGTLGYTGSGDASGCDTLTVRVDDRGHTGDADGDGMPSEPVDDALDATTSVARWTLMSYELGQHAVWSGQVAVVDAQGQRAERALPPLTLRVESILPEAGDQLRDPKGLAYWPRAPMTRLFWLLGLIGLVALLAGLLVRWWMTRSRKPTPGPAPIPAHEKALRALAELEQRTDFASVDPEGFFVAVSAIVRRYLEERFALRAPEQTTEEFIRSASSSKLLSPDHQRLVEEFLAESDLVKFARHRPGADRMKQALAAAYRLVRETVPAAIPPLPGGAA